MEPIILRGIPPKGSGYGYGHGSGSGYGHGYGDGDGDGYGSGSGSGDGYGYGSGSGYGDGDGDGYGSGSGSGDGYGYGDGDGYGSGDGYGYGSGSGYGSEEYWSAIISWFASKWKDGQRERLARLQAGGAIIAFWRSKEDGRPANGGAADPAFAGKIERVDGPLEICTHRALHATLIPPKWKGERWWIVALIGEVQKQGDKLAALQREIIGECL